MTNHSQARLFSRTIVDLLPDVTWNVPVTSNHGLINCAAEESCALQTSQVRHSPLHLIPFPPVALAAATRPFSPPPHTLLPNTCLCQVVFHIVGVSTCTPLQRCYFTLRFFHFPLVQTSSCAVTPDGPPHLASSSGYHNPATLKCEASGREGATVSFVIDPRCTSAHALPSAFAQYCHSHCAELSVYVGGSCIIDRVCHRWTGTTQTHTC